MIVLDTNVISELLTPAPNVGVIEWLGAQHPLSVFTTAITEAEILYGLRLLPHGRRRNDLEAAVLPIFNEDMSGRVLPFDRDAADVYAIIATDRRKAGRPISQFDAQIAAIAISRGASLATRNVSDFEGIGLQIINPWTDH
ncbi:type II toxin-antitoxin system VapC family toxin [Rhizobium sp. 25PS6]|uniref:type II toxin-antitoxin system VapC family toxin n=1 Tax=Rhizobium TaxID=379 RepID=UPI0003E0BD96|nr:MULTISPECIES: type II toxin-antitoxin system VapC family toxin [Rhizobium]NKL74850.1 PIN domain-containing protein [Rhizobium leguminosarum bv. viciae]AHF87935.1 plasmid stability protein StbB [Rhizobium leguminosarum bv. trifolii WSM1689]MBY3038457.1 type II toxin-antitoxin system VapC family toxin [Rhizobium laguerreae]MBY3182944.1 type II toxin-antitoxin system VapC family toxin [Rhizobium laguerreae]MBY3195859.1 type II toxin-antitoxin system VapC family toxin [Rhizobium laguerreae]